MVRDVDHRPRQADAASRVPSKRNPFDSFDWLVAHDMIRRLARPFLYWWGHRRRVDARPPAVSWLPPYALRRHWARLQSLDTSGGRPPVLLELKVDLRTQRDRRQFDRLTQFCREAAGDGASLGYLDADRLAILVPRSDAGQVERLMEQLRHAWGVDVQRVGIDAAATSPSPARKGHLRRAVAGLKSGGERAAGALGLVLVAPLLLLLALTVKISKPGPVLTVHHRPGRNGRRCRVYRFRAHAAPASMIRPALRDDFPAAGGSRFGHRPRPLSVDRLLTETRLHRLPQLWNVVRGELPLRSLAGRTARPRPRTHPGFNAPHPS